MQLLSITLRNTIQRINLLCWCSRAVSWIRQFMFEWHPGPPHLLRLSCVSSQSTLNGQLAVVHGHLRGQRPQLVWTCHWFGHLRDKHTHRPSIQAKNTKWNSLYCLQTTEHFCQHILAVMSPLKWNSLELMTLIHRGASAMMCFGTKQTNVSTISFRKLIFD